MCTSRVHNHTMKPNITPASPMLMPASSLPPLAAPFVADADGELAVPEAVLAAVAVAAPL